MATEYGKNLKISIYGASHGECIGIQAKNLPKDFTFNFQELLSFMARRAPGKDEFSTARREPDLPEFLSGVSVNGEHCTVNGEDFHAIIRNTSQGMMFLFIFFPQSVQQYQ